MSIDGHVPGSELDKISVVSIRVGKAQLQVDAGLDGRVFVGPVTAVDDGFIIRMQEKGQRLACA